MTTIRDLRITYGVEINAFKDENGVESNTHVEIIEATDTTFAGWYTEGPFVVLLAIEDGVVWEKVVEF